MTKIIIPTYNRSAKLDRTLRSYHSFGSGFVPDIVVLDGSDEEAHLRQNQKVCSYYPNLQYISMPGTGFVPRILPYLEKIEGNTPVCLATDEDVFTPEYIRVATELLNTTPEYSMLLGRYFTFLRPIGPFHRISHHRSVVNNLDINQNEMKSRMGLLSTALTLGCSPVYWGVRRVDQLIASLKLQDKLKFYTSQELVDQILLAHQGMIRITDMPMLLRDETNIGYIIEEIRQDAINHIPSDEIDLLSRILVEEGGVELLEASSVLIDRYLLDYVASGAPCLAVQSHLKAYTKYEPLQSGSKNLTYRLAYIVMKIAVVVTELFTATREIRVLKSMYKDKSLNIFLQKIKSNQIFKAK